LFAIQPEPSITTHPPKPILPSCGVDLIEVDRIRKKLEDAAFLERIFTKRERDECLRRAKPEECLAARWAAKEAVAKALGVGIGQYLTFQNVEVISGKGKAPRIHLSGPYAKYPMRIALSFTHTHITAAAVVMIYPDV
jgi:holo-[acyl-carrier protein] synthase